MKIENGFNTTTVSRSFQLPGFLESTDGPSTLCLNRLRYCCLFMSDFLEAIPSLEDHEILIHLRESFTEQGFDDELTTSEAKTIVLALRERGFSIVRTKSQSYRSALKGFCFPSVPSPPPSDAGRSSPASDHNDENDDQEHSPINHPSAEMKKELSRLQKRVRDQDRRIRQLKKRKTEPTLQQKLLEGLDSLRPPKQSTTGLPTPESEEVSSDGNSDSSDSAISVPPAPLNGVAQPPFPLVTRRMRLNCSQREASKIYGDMVAQSGTATAFVTSLSMDKKRNYREAWTLARAADMYADQFSNAAVATVDAFEVLLRRLVAVIQADSTNGDWENATFLEETPDGRRVGSDSLYRAANRLAAISRTSRPRNRSTVHQRTQEHSDQPKGAVVRTFTPRP